MRVERHGRAMSQKQKKDAIKHAARVAIKAGLTGDTEPVRKAATRIVNRNARLAADRAEKRAARECRSITRRAESRRAELVGA